ncbi:MAG TPA: hypothetical protein PK073_07110 [Ignavibacteriaceae bacterium]|jgi:O-antigen ligase|nr:MAG: hypothetical protein BWY38_01689 [Ignavibacteria bacterium ADurb.Bin266]OQY72714.1 MAG: hypothetical protein B6D44_09510 [Ignavibacteriales bacterium UTCHB2]HQF42667.1 hypothetical protein [Ignavibacteriaceae bacterium]HQI41159.1 hypothetical protein [Ignavibacteriaceae bacterium]
MFLVIGTFLLALGLITVFHNIFFKRLPKTISYILLFIITSLLFFTKTVHGIWLGLTILIFGFLWVKFFVKRKVAVKNNNSI